MAGSNEFFGSDNRSPASSYECKRLFSRISKIITDAGLKITNNSYEDPEKFIKRVSGTPGENDPNAFIEINGDSRVEMNGFTSDSYESPEVSLDGSLPEEVVSKIQKSVESVEGWKFFNLSRPVNESSSKDKKKTFYRGYVILRRNNVKTGEVSYDVVNPEKGRSPVWTDLGSEVEAKRWINRDISSKSESLKESSSTMDYERILREVTRGVQVDGNLTRAIGTSDLQMDIFPTDDAINRVVSSAESMGFKEVSREIDERPENDSWIVLVNETNEGRCVIGIVFNAEYDYAWVTAGDSEEYDDYFEESSQRDKRLSATSERYRGYLISLDRKGHGYNVFDKERELEDSGFKSVDDAKKFIDKTIESLLTESPSSSVRRISLDSHASDLPDSLYNSLVMDHNMTVERVNDDTSMPWDSDLTIKGGQVVLVGGIVPGGAGFGSCTVKIPVEKFNEYFTISVSNSVDEIKDDLENYGWDVK